MFKLKPNPFDNDLDLGAPIYPISTAAKLLNIHPRSLIKYENEGILKPYRNPHNNHRMYSKSDLNWIQCIRTIIHKEGVNIKSIRYLLTRIPCWGLKNCDSTKRINCSAYQHFTKPCWEVVNGICPKNPCDTCNKCEVFKLAEKQREVVTKNLMMESIQ